MILFFHILISLLLVVFGHTTQAIDVSTVQLNQKIESSIAKDAESFHKRDLLHSSIARTCNFVRNLVSYWEGFDKDLVKAGGKFTLQQIEDWVKFSTKQNDNGIKRLC